jgi:TatD DNase family protein
MIDTHAHILKEYYKDDLEKVISESLLKLDKIINIAFSVESSKEIVELSKKHENIYSVIGVHPNDSKGMTISDVIELEKLIDDKVVAIGEIGLDYHYEGYDKEEQKEVFISLIELAQRHNLPVVIHSREANEDTIEIIKNYKDVKFLFHS